MADLLDLCCGAGGAAMGYSRAGFDRIVGVDINPQPRYPFEFIQGDGLEYLAEHGHEFDSIHVSPPCQGYSIMRNLPWLKDKEYPLLIDPFRELLEATGKLWVIENVMGAHLPAGWLCGTMFGLPFYRHRLFETNWFWMQPGHTPHQVVSSGDRDRRPHMGVAFTFGPDEDKRGLATWPGRRDQRAGLAVVKNPVNSGWRQHHDGVGALASGQGNGAQKNGVGVGHAKGWRLAAEAMDIDWMKRDELTQAIPPAYTEHIGAALLRQLEVRQ